MISLLLTILRNLADGIKQLNTYSTLWKCPHPPNICFHKLTMLGAADTAQAAVVLWSFGEKGNTLILDILEINLHLKC